MKRARAKRPRSPRRNGPRPRGPEEDARRTELVRLLVEEALPLADAAAKVGVPERTAREWVRKYGPGIASALEGGSETPASAAEQARKLRDLAYAQVLASNAAGRANDAKAHALVWAIATDKLKLAQAATAANPESPADPISRLTLHELRVLAAQAESELTQEQKNYIAILDAMFADSGDDRLCPACREKVWRARDKACAPPAQHWLNVEGAVITGAKP